MESIQYHAFPLRFSLCLITLTSTASFFSSPPPPPPPPNHHLFFFCGGWGGGGREGECVGGGRRECRVYPTTFHFISIFVEINTATGIISGGIFHFVAFCADRYSNGHHQWRYIPFCCFLCRSIQQRASSVEEVFCLFCFYCRQYRFIPFVYRHVLSYEVGA